MVRLDHKAARWRKRVFSSRSSLEVTQQVQTKSAANNLTKISASTLSVLILASACEVEEKVCAYSGLGNSGAYWVLPLLWCSGAPL